MNVFELKWRRGKEKHSFEIWREGPLCILKVTNAEDRDHWSLCAVELGKEEAKALIQQLQLFLNEEDPK